MSWRRHLARTVSFREAMTAPNMLLHRMSLRDAISTLYQFDGTNVRTGAFPLCRVRDAVADTQGAVPSIPENRSTAKPTESG